MFLLDWQQGASDVWDQPDLASDCNFPNSSLPICFPEELVDAFCMEVAFWNYFFLDR
jgi:hypothetical protein